MQIKIYYTLFILMILFGCGQRPGNPGDNKLSEVPVAVAVEPFQLKPFEITYHGIGRVESRQRVNLLFEVPGKVDSILAEAGDFVEKDQPLAKIGQEQYRANYIRAKSAYDKANKDLVSAEELYGSNIISKDQYDQFKLAYDNAHANFIQARTALNNTVLSAPFNGRIIHRNLQVGDVIVPGVMMNPPFVLADMKRLKVVVSVPESEISRIRAGQEVELTFKSYPGEVFPGTVYRVGLATQTLSNTFDVEIQIESPTEELKLGLIADVYIVIEKINQGLVLPIRLIHSENDQKFIFLVDGNRAKRVPLELVKMSGSEVLVKGELAAGDSVIVRGDVTEGTLLSITSNDRTTK